jgi:hypothetical protein
MRKSAGYFTFIFNFFLCTGLQSLAQPANDNVCNATNLILQNLDCEPTTAYAWTNATHSSSNGLTHCNGSQNRDVWFRATVPANGEVKVSIAENGVSSMAAEIYRGTDCNNIAIVQESVEGFPCIYTQNFFGGTPYRTYTKLAPGSFIFIRVFPLNNITIANAGIKICVSNTAGLADEPCDAGFIPVEPADPLGQACSPVKTFSYNGATLSAGIPNPDCTGMNPSNIRDVWMKVRVPASGKLNINSSGIGKSIAIQVLTGPACNGTFTQIACLASGGPINLTSLVPNSILYVRMFVWTGGVDNAATFKLCLSGRNDLPPVNNNSGKVGIGIDTPFTKLHVVGSGFFQDRVVTAGDLETRGNLIVRGQIINSSGNNTQLSGINVTGTSNMEKLNISSNAGIKSISDLDSIQMTNRFGAKVGLWGAMSGNHYGLGIQSGLLQLYTDAASANIVFGHGRSGAFTERVRMYNSGEYGMSVNGRLILRNGTNIAAQAAGIWLNRPDNSAFQGFIGIQNEQHMGFFGGPTNWGFNYNTSNGRVGIGANPQNHILEVVSPASASPATIVIGNRGGFGPAALEFVSDYGLLSQWRPGFIRSGDGGGFKGRLEFFTNGAGSDNLYGAVKGLEVREGVALTATGSVGNFSDGRLKENIHPFTDGLNVVSQINPVQFLYKSDAPFATSQPQVGVVAQELEKAAPYMVHQTEEGDYNDLRWVNNQAYIFLLINSVKELKEKVEAQQAEIERLKKRKKR